MRMIRALFAFFKLQNQRNALAATAAAFATANAGSLPIFALLTRAADAAGTIRGTSDISPVQYFTCVETGTANWRQSTLQDI